MQPTFVLGLTGSVVTLTLVFELLRRRKLREKYAIFWVVVALATISFAAFPRSLEWISARLGVQVPTNLLFFLASMVLMVISLQHSQELGRMEERTRSLAEELALVKMRLERSSEDDETSAAN